ncbi:MAG TPA: hypothetical protein VMT55_04020 [Candidatus Sulfotelmatobacter sp.]|nr:hypothetical protein [Candidatus Sulfotelmatobacter sp.]
MKELLQKTGFRWTAILFCLFLALSIYACGERQESSKFYYSPTWTRAGTVPFILGLQTVRKDAIGTELGSSYYESVCTMDAAGAGENFWFDVTGATLSAMSCSPTTDYLAYLDDLRNGLYGKIVIRNISGTLPHTGLDTIDLVFSPGIKSFDWSNTGTQLVYCTTKEVRVRDWNDFTGATDALVVAETSLETVSWQTGTRIAYVHATAAGKVLSIITPGGAATDLTVAQSVDKPQISSVNPNMIYGIAGGAYCVVDVSAPSVPVVILPNFKGDQPRLAPTTADKVVYSKTATESSGIYILNLTTSAETKIK